MKEMILKNESDCKLPRENKMWKDTSRWGTQIKKIFTYLASAMCQGVVRWVYDKDQIIIYDFNVYNLLVKQDIYINDHCINPWDS